MLQQREQTAPLRRRTRSLWKALCRCRRTGVLIYLWLWGLDNATKDGLILSADEDDIVQFISYAGAGCSLDPKKIVKALFDSGWLDWTESGIYIHDWDVWQEQWYKVTKGGLSITRSRLLITGRTLYADIQQ